MLRGTEKSGKTDCTADINVCAGVLHKSSWNYNINIVIWFIARVKDFLLFLLFLS